MNLDIQLRRFLSEVFRAQPALGFLLIIKWDKLRQQLLSKKEPGLDNFKNHQTIKTAKNAKIKRYTIRRACPGKKTKGQVQILPVPRKDLKLRVFGHTEGS